MYAIVIYLITFSDPFDCVCIFFLWCVLQLVFIPLWILLCVSLILVVYNIIMTSIMDSSGASQVEQRNLRLLIFISHLFIILSLSTYLVSIIYRALAIVTNLILIQCQFFTKKSTIALIDGYFSLLLYGSTFMAYLVISKDLKLCKWIAHTNKPTSSSI